MSVLFCLCVFVIPCFALFLCFFYLILFLVSLCLEECAINITVHMLNFIFRVIFLALI